jgi:hypothetical protein
VLEPIWVAQLYISPRTASKLTQLHGLQADDARDAVQCVPGLLAERVYDEELQCIKFLVEVQMRRGVRRTRVLVVLFSVDDPLGDIYALGSAYPRV